MPDPDPEPMLGQFWVELEFDELDEPDEPDELEEFELDPDEVVPEPELPDVDVLGVLEEEVELEPEPDVVDVVAAPATNAPPATRPEVSAPAARTLRNRICMDVALSRSGAAPARSSEWLHAATRTCGRAHIDLGLYAEFADESMTIVTFLTACWVLPVPRRGNAAAR